VKWEEVRQIYPNRFVKMKVIKEKIQNDIRNIDKVEVIVAFTNKEASELIYWGRYE